IIISAMNGGAQYASTVLLDEKGMARGDYNIVEGIWSPYEPAWHTGQIVYGLVEAFRITGKKEYLDNAIHAGKWWNSLVITDNPKLNGMLRTIHGGGIEKICFTTLCDGANGMFELSRVSKNNTFAQAATSAGEWALGTMYLPEEGMFYDFVDPVTGDVQKTWSDFWPEKKLQILTDVARPNNEGYLYKDMYEFTKNEKYKKVFIGLCESLVKRQGPEGLWMEFTPNNKAENRFHPRFNLWYAESLIEGYELTGNKRYLDAAVKTLKFYTKYQKKDGTIYYVNSLDGASVENSPSGSTVSFAGMLWLRLLKLGVGEAFRENVERSFRWVITNRYSADHPDRNLADGFYNVRMSVKKGKQSLVQRDIGTAFGLRFLAAYYRWKFPQ
ncbi:MAG: hypothetical protein ACOYNS_13160, partial [Bacteroidota bacterium]